MTTTAPLPHDFPARDPRDPTAPRVCLHCGALDYETGAEDECRVRLREYANQLAADLALAGGGA